MPKNIQAAKPRRQRPGDCRNMRDVTPLDRPDEAGDFGRPGGALIISERMVLNTLSSRTSSAPSQGAANGFVTIGRPTSEPRACATAEGRSGRTAAHAVSATQSRHSVAS